MAQIDKPNLNFNTVLYSGTGSNQSVTGTGFTADWIWLKERNGADYHFVNDSVRGIGSNNHYLNIFPNANAAEVDQTTGLNAINSNGFDITYRAELNESGKNYFALNWKANGAGSANTDGSINSTVSVNTTSGFSIVKYTGNGSSGATVGHGLGAVPKMMLVKCRSNADTWAGYHVSVGATKYMELDTDAAAQTSTQPWNDTEPTSSVFTVGNWSATNLSGRTYIAYCFAEKKGFSKFGSYTGNGNANGPFIYLGFKPAFVVIKQTNTANHWYMWDNKRDPDNPTNVYSRPDTDGAEGSYNWLDFVSNGIKIRNTSSGASTSGGTYLYWAFAENPIVGSNNIPATAR